MEALQTLHWVVHSTYTVVKLLALHLKEHSSHYPSKRSRNPLEAMTEYLPCRYSISDSSTLRLYGQIEAEYTAAFSYCCYRYNENSSPFHCRSYALLQQKVHRVVPRISPQWFLHWYLYSQRLQTSQSLLVRIQLLHQPTLSDHLHGCLFHHLGCWLGLLCPHPVLALFLCIA